VIPAIDRTELSANNNGLTVKRCMPFLDALTTRGLVPQGSARAAVTGQAAPGSVAAIWDWFVLARNVPEMAR
jgi:hypothetical protein